MKIFFFLNILPPYRIGLYNKISEKLNGGAKFFFDSYSEKNRIWNIAEDSIKFDYEILNSPNVNLMSKASNNTKLFRTVYFPFKLLQICFTEKPDIVVSLEMGVRTIFSIIFCIIYKKKIYLLSEVIPQSEKKISRIKKIIRKIISKNINGGIAHGRFSLEYLKSFGLPENKITISPDSIDNDFFLEESKKYIKSELRKKTNIDDDAFIFLFVGQFIHRKGIDLLSNCIRKFKNENSNIKFFVFLVGGGKEGLIKIIGNYDENLFTQVEFKQKEDLIKYYVISDCLIFPTRNDVWGMVVNESIACGLPVMVSKYAGCADDLIENEKNGYVFDPLDENSFINTLKKCIENKDKLKSFAEKAKEKLKIYNHENAANKIVDFII